MSSGGLSQTLLHLSQASKIVDGDNRTRKLLNCYYQSRIQRLAAFENISVEKSSGSSCTKCMTSFSDSKNFSLAITPRRLRKEKYEKMVRNSERKCRNDNDAARRRKNKLGLKYKRLVYNIAEITCNFCKSKNKFSIRFDNKEKSLAKSKDPPTIELSALKLVNDKKRKLDQEPKTEMTKNANPVSSTSTASTKPKVQSIKVVHTKVKTNQKAKNFTNESKKTKNVTPAQKQRKGMLLLASVLKMNDHKQQNDSQLKLNKMFK